MQTINKNDYQKYAYLNREITKKVILERKNSLQIAEGKKTSNKISPKASLVLNSIFSIVLETGVNELCIPKKQLTELLDTDPSNTNRDLKTYFKGYGLGDYSFSNKYDITISGKSKKIKRGTHYYIYINKETLELMKSVIEIEGLDFDELISQIPECERKCKEISAKTETTIDVYNYIDDDFISHLKINIEKNLFTKEGHFSKETSIINAEDDSVINLGKKENEFIPKKCNENQIINRLEEISNKDKEEVIEKEMKEEYIFEQLSEEDPSVYYEEPIVPITDEELEESSKEYLSDIEDEEISNNDEDYTIQPKQSTLDNVRNRKLNRKSLGGNAKCIIPEQKLQCEKEDKEIPKDLSELEIDEIFVKVIGVTSEIGESIYDETKEQLGFNNNRNVTEEDYDNYFETALIAIAEGEIYPGNVSNIQYVQDIFNSIRHKLNYYN